jgi:hypothetical protein
VIPQALSGREIEIVNLIGVGLAGLPVLREGSPKGLARYPKQVLVFLKVHAEPFGVLQDLVLCN